MKERRDSCFDLDSDRGGRSEQTAGWRGAIGRAVRWLGHNKKEIIPRLLTDLVLPTYPFAMNVVVNNQIVIEELPYDPELDRLFEQAHRNLMWFNEHVGELEVFKLYRGRFVAAAGGELFVADSREQVERLAREKHPDEMPHIRYIPREKLYRIYAN